jgi:hypothetical protein
MYVDSSTDRRNGKAHALLQGLRRRWLDLELTVAAGLDQCATLCATEVQLKDHRPYQLIPQPRPAVRALLDAAGVELPAARPNKQPRVTTNTKGRRA